MNLKQVLTTESLSVGEHYILIIYYISANKELQQYRRIALVSKLKSFRGVL